jgi:hypothetical protein
MVQQSNVDTSLCSSCNTCGGCTRQRSADLRRFKPSSNK